MKCEEEDFELDVKKVVYAGLAIVIIAVGITFLMSNKEKPNTNKVNTKITSTKKIKEDTKPQLKAEAKPDVKEDVDPEPKVETKPDIKEEVKHQPEINIKTVMYKRIIENKQEKWVETKSVSKDDLLMFTTTIKNKSEQEEENLNIENPIAENLIYIKSSAHLTTEGKIQFSIDSEVINSPKNIYLYKNGIKVRASNKDYRSINWIIKKLKGHDKVELYYKAKLNKNYKK